MIQGSEHIAAVVIDHDGSVLASTRVQNDEGALVSLIATVGEIAAGR